MFVHNHDNLPARLYQSFISRPDLQPPVINVNGTGTSGLVFFDQAGRDVHKPALIIADHNGDIIYFNDSLGGVSNFDVASFGGQDYLSAWNGTMVMNHGIGEGSYLLMDNSLNIVQSIAGASERNLDVHEFRVVRDTDTALVSFYYPLSMNLTAWGGPANGNIYGSGFQHIDMRTGNLIFEWMCTDHISPVHSLNPPEKDHGDGKLVEDGGLVPWDYFHLNSVDVHPTDGKSVIHMCMQAFPLTCFRVLSYLCSLHVFYLQN